MTKIRNIYLLRHGKTLGKAALNGRTDVLVDKDIQAHISDSLVKSKFAIDSIITSPLQRCSYLADKHASRMNLPLITVPELQEMDFGDLDGQAFDDLEEQWPILESFWNDPANHQLIGAESLQSFNLRVIKGWSQVLSLAHDNVLVVTHGGVIRMLLAHLLNVDWRNPSWYSNLAINNASITHIQITEADQAYISVKCIGSTLTETTTA